MIGQKQSPRGRDRFNQDRAASRRSSRQAVTVASALLWFRHEHLVTVLNVGAGSARALPLAVGRLLGLRRPSVRSALRQEGRVTTERPF
jgi:hypothetical protein